MLLATESQVAYDKIHNNSLPHLDFLGGSSLSEGNEIVVILPSAAFELSAEMI